MGSGEWGVGSGEWGVGSGEWGVGSRESGVGSGEWGVLVVRHVFSRFGLTTGLEWGSVFFWVFWVA